MFETISFGKQQTLLTICMIMWGDNGDEDGETRLSRKSILQPKSTIKEVHVAKIEAFWKLLLAMDTPTKTRAFGFYSIVQQ
jgi:hypothetical protein